MKKQSQVIGYFWGMVIFLTIVSPVNATLTIRVSDGANVFTIPDGSAGELSSLAGAVLYTNSFGSAALNVDTGLSKPVIGSAAVPELHLDSVLVSSGPINLTIALSDTNFAGAGRFIASIGGVLNSTAGSTVTYTVYRDLANVLFGTGPGTFLCTTGPLSANSLFYFGGGCLGEPTGDSAYSLTLVGVINHLGPGNSSFNAILVDVPEPASMILLGLGLIGLGSWMRIRKRR